MEIATTATGRIIKNKATGFIDTPMGLNLKEISPMIISKAGASTSMMMASMKGNLRPDRDTARGPWNLIT